MFKGGPKVDDMNKVLFKDWSGVNRIQKSVNEVLPINVTRNVTTSKILKHKLTGKSFTCVILIRNHVHHVNVGHNYSSIFLLTLTIAIGFRFQSQIPFLTTSLRSTLQFFHKIVLN